MELNKNAVTFGREETVKTIEVSILADGLAEETEAFQLNLFKSQTSSTPDATIDAYVNNVSNGSFSYTISSNGSTSDAAINEGTDLNLTITRDGSGSVSTVYLSSSNVTTSNGDLAQLSYKPIQFSAKETVKTVTITTYEDTTTEGTEALSFISMMVQPRPSQSLLGTCTSQTIGHRIITILFIHPPALRRLLPMKGIQSHLMS